ncbi:protease inhibitor I42 family protein [Streptomyces sp. NPDC056492]|uniref:protease inhibitor I42 family protein n=1 Tax=unclassified Streptomyces TaxID=2593676 RepID=UPI0036BA707A
MPLLLRTAAAAALCALAVFPTEAAGAVPTAPTAHETGTDSDRSVTLRLGQSTDVVLDENPSTGYQWQITALPSPLRLKSSTYTPSPNPSHMVGRGGVHTFRFTAVRRGTGDLKFANRRPSEPSAPPADTLTVKVTVR